MRAAPCARRVMLRAVLTSLDHIGVLVADLPAATRAYAALLGRSPAWKGEHPGEGTANAIFRLGNTSVELIGPALDAAAHAAAPSPLLRRLAEQGEGLAYLAFATDDAKEARETCRARGLDAGAPTAGLAHDADSGAFRRYQTVILPLAQTGGVELRLVENQSPDELLHPGPLAGAEDAVAASLDHVVVMTEDPERAIELYRDRLGIRLALDRSFEHRGVRLLFFRIGGTTVEVGASIAPGGDGAENAADDAPRADRLWGAAYRVDDVDAARARLADAGVAASDVRVGNKPGTRVFTVKGETHGVPTLIIGDE